MTKIVIGLTGRIGSGKSVIAKIFEDCGAFVIDTDVIAHNLTNTNTKVLELIKDQFGKEFILTTGALDRTKMRGVIFSDSIKKKQLEKILHPIILNEVISLLQTSTAKCNIIVVPLLLQVPDFINLVDRILVIITSNKLQFERVKARSGLTVDEIQNILNTQSSVDELIKHSDDIIYNNGSLNELQIKISNLYMFYLNCIINQDKS